MTKRAKKLLLLYYKQSRKIRRVSGLPPLTFKAKKAGTLKNYRIYGNTETKTRSYSGSAPLSFPITDGAVSNYRVYGNTVNGESVGDLVETGEHAGEYRVPVTVTNGTDTETTNLYLPEQIKMVGDEAEYVDYKEQKQHRVRKNLFNYNTHAGTIQGYLFNDDRRGLNDTWQITDYISCDGYVFTISPIGGNDPSICLYDKDKHFITGKNYDTGNVNIKTGVTITSDIKASFVRFSYKKEGDEQQVDDLSNIMLNSGSEPLPYEPYIENTEVDVTLPALPAQSTSNSLSIGTSVQPSSVAVDVAEVVSCGEKVTDSQSVNYGKYKIPLTLTADSAETTDIYLDEPLRKVGNESDYIDYVEQKQHWVRKNLLKNTMARQIINGVTFTANEDGSITCNGTAGASAPSVLNIPFTLPIELYEVSGCPDSGGNSTYRVDIRNNDSSVCNYNGNSVIDNGTGCLFDGGNNKNYCIRIAPGYTCDNLTFYPMIRKVDIEDDTYEPYIENTEVDVILPGIAVTAGINTLTVGTEVQPSGVEIKGRIKAAGGD